MLHNFWRKLHLTLAIVAGLFLLIASITGAILSFEPIEQIQHSYHVENAEEIALVDFITTLDSTYQGVDFVEATMDENGFLQLSIIDEEGEMDAFYIDPRTGKKLGTVTESSELYDFNRKLHRSLFMGTAGRLTMGIVAALLSLMVISGIILVFKRQLKAWKFFGKITRDSSLSYLHIQFGRWTFPLLIVISVTGTYLSLDRFGFLPKENKVKHTIDFEMLADSPEKHKYEFSVFQNTTLADLQKLQFPFTPFPEDYYQLRLHDRDIIVNQSTGGIESTQHLGEVKGWNDWVFNLHTGKGSIGWSILLFFAAISIVFFVVSGFSIIVKRWRSKSKNVVSKNEANVVILVGSESGQTAAFAKHFKNLLQQNGHAAYIDVLNNFQQYPRLDQLFVLTSTYGNGEAPSNARNFKERLKLHAPTREFEFNVLGFGSIDYPDYCQFATEVQEALEKLPIAKERQPLTKINKQSSLQKQHWLKQVLASFDIVLDAEDMKQKRESDTFIVQKITPPSAASHQHFRLELSTKQTSFQSGDLLAILPEGLDEERFYSIGKINDRIALSIRKHEHGACSSFLAQLSHGDTITARIQKNEHFHLPETASTALLIANGTGIAPLLGMISENTRQIPVDLIWGMKSETVSDAYKERLRQMQQKNQLQNYQFLYSQSAKTAKQYVQDVLGDSQQKIVQILSENGVIMICGSITMRDEVLQKLAALIKDVESLQLEECLNRGQILSDCY